MTLAEIEAQGEPGPLRWTNERYLALVESGVIEEGRGVELIDGQVVTSMPQGKLHNLLFLALQQAFRRIDFGDFLIATQTTIILRQGNTYDPEFALLRAEYDPRELPKGEDVLWAVEVSVTSRRTDLNEKKAGYAAAGVPEYWVVDAAKRGVWVFTNPVEGDYRRGTFVPSGEPILVPGAGAMLDTGAIFPRAEREAPAQGLDQPNVAQL